MNEEFLHYVWQYQYLSITDLKTTANDEVVIIHQGIRNDNQGPDFSEAKVKINDVEWSGNVEIHTQSSHWNSHKHNKDKVYNSVILHVVWDHNKAVKRHDGTEIPTIELKNRVDHDLILRYRSLMFEPRKIPCANQMFAVSKLKRISMLDRVLAERLYDKSKILFSLLANNKDDWEETTYQLLAKNFGFKVNSEAFLALSKSLPLKIILKHGDNQLQIEALLFGQAGFLDNKDGDEYYQKLKSEYEFLAHKYKLLDKKLSTEVWRFLRLRPANFPMVRISQFAALIHKYQNLFSLFIEIETFKKFTEKLKVEQSAYWKKNYHFSSESVLNIHGLGGSSIKNIIINTAIPLLFSYGKVKDESIYVDKAISLLEALPAEENRITKEWLAYGMSIYNAADSQALIELFNKYCQKRKCLSCNIGISLIKGQDM